eukprot:5038495-Karenia_brevis.AAC.1
MGCLRWISGVTRMQQHQQHMSNEKVRNMLRINSIEEMLNQKVLRWVGHVARMDNKRAAKQLLFSWVAEGTRGTARGLRYKDTV